MATVTIKTPNGPQDITVPDDCAPLVARFQEREAEQADSAWNLTDLGQWAIDRAEALRRAKLLVAEKLASGAWAPAGTVFFGSYDVEGVRRNRAGEVVGYIRADGSEVAIPDPLAP